MKNAVVLLSGGLDSATTLYLAKRQGFKCFCLSFDYGQYHRREIESAKRIAQSTKSPYHIIKIKLPWKGSALLDKKIKIPKRYNAITQERNNAIPSTYVPSRNIIFLSFALSYAEAIKARTIFIGAHIQDYSGYPDCRPEFYQSFVKAARLGTKAGTEGKPIKIIAPLIHKSKAQIVRLAEQLGLPFELTWSCYKGRRVPCGECDSCYFRKRGFKEAGIKDPLLSSQ